MNQFTTFVHRIHNAMLQYTTRIHMEHTALRPMILRTALRVRIAVLCAVLALSLIQLTAPAASAEGWGTQQDDPLAKINQQVTDAAHKVSTLARPLVLISIVACLFIYAISGAVPEWAQERRGVIAIALIAGITLSFADSLVNFFIPAPTQTGTNPV